MTLQLFLCKGNRTLQVILLISFGATAGAAQQSPTGDETLAQRLEAAHHAENLKEFPEASRQYEQILKLQPKLPLIHQSLAVTYHLQNRYSEAISEFRQALRLDPKLWGADLFLGMDYYKSNQFTLAIEPLRTSIALNAKMAEPEAHFWLAVTYSALGKPSEAVRELRRDLELRPNDVEVLYYLTRAYDDAASPIFERLGQIEPQSAAVSLLQAERFTQENRADLARLEFRKALQLRPDLADWFSGLVQSLAGTDAPVQADLKISAPDARANLELATLFADGGDPTQAATVLRHLIDQKGANSTAAQLIVEADTRLRAIQHRPEGTAPRKEGFLIAFELLRERNFPGARTLLAPIAAKQPNSYLQLMLVRCSLEMGNYAFVEDTISKLLSVEPGNVDALLLLGHSFKRQADMTLHQMVQADPDFYGVHELLGKQDEERTEYEGAITEYQAALSKRPDLAGVRYAIGNVYRKMSQYEQAERWLIDELERNPYHGLAHYRLGSIYTEQGRPDAAIPHLEQALRSYPHLRDAQLDLGRAYTAKGEYERAITTLRRVAVADPENDRVHYLLSAAYSKEGRREESRTELAAYQRLTRTRLDRTQQDVKSLSDSLDQR